MTHTEAVPNINLSYYLRCHWWLYWLLLQELWNNQKGIRREGDANNVNCIAIYSIIFTLLCCIVLSFLRVVLCCILLLCAAADPDLELSGRGALVFCHLPCQLFFLLQFLFIFFFNWAPPLNPPLVCSTV